MINDIEEGKKLVTSILSMAAHRPILKEWVYQNFSY